jgi:hypothetical protein
MLPIGRRVDLGNGCNVETRWTGLLGPLGAVWIGTGKAVEEAGLGKLGTQ